MQSHPGSQPLRAAALVVAAAFTIGAAPAAALNIMNPGQLVWTEAPPMLPKGARHAVVFGDPAKPGPFVLRARLPAGYTVPLHWHSNDESLTILNGTLELTTHEGGMAHVHVVETGGFHHVPAGVRHVARARTTVEFQVHGQGPFDINYVKAGEDPRRAMKHQGAM